MASKYNDAPEPIACSSYPEAIPTLYHEAPIPWQSPPAQQQEYDSFVPTSATAAKPGHLYPAPQGIYHGAPRSLSDYQPGAVYAESASIFPPDKGNGERLTSERAAETKRTTICGCAVITFVLSAIIAILAGAVAGLAVSTGIQTDRINESNNKLQNLQASISNSSVASQTTTGGGKATGTTTATTTVTATAVIDNGCSSNPDAVNGEVYTAFKLLGSARFTMRCNKDVNAPNLMSLFASDFNACMDSCSAWTMYAPKMFGNGDNSTCTGVSFIPLWTTQSAALKGSAPGNCYLKKTKLDSSAFKDANAGTPVLGAILA